MGTTTTVGATGIEPGPTDALAQLDEGKLSPRQRKAALLVAFGEFIDGYDLLVMGAAVIFIRPQFGLSPSEVGLLGASTFLGAMLGLLIFGDMSDRLGRRAIFIANLFFFVVFAILSAFVTTTTQLFIVRFLVGVGVGMDIPTSTAYLAEIAPRRERGPHRRLPAQHHVGAGRDVLDAGRAAAGSLCRAGRMALDAGAGGRPRAVDPAGPQGAAGKPALADRARPGG